MSKFQQILLILMMLSSPQTMSSEKVCSVTKIIDGDTVWAQCGAAKEKIRMTIIDSFEKSMNNRAFRQAYQQKISIEEVVRRGKLASKYTTIALLRKDVIVKINDKNPKDQYGRTLGEIYIKDVNINLKLLKDHPDVFLKY